MKNKRNFKILLFALSLVVMLVIGIRLIDAFSKSNKNADLSDSRIQITPAQSAAEARLKDARKLEMQSPKQAIAVYEEIAKKHSTSGPMMSVKGLAEYRIGMIYASQKSFTQAHHAFSKLAKQDNKTLAMPENRDFGTWSEQGAYQAAICLHKQNPKEGTEAMTDFVSRHADSALAYGGYKRLMTWSNDHTTPEMNKAWIKIKTAEAERKRMSFSCGPQALAYAFSVLGIKSDYHALMKECKTNAQGTSMKALMDAAHNRNLSCVGLEVTLKGLKNQNSPLILWSPDGHFVTIMPKGNYSSEWMIFDPTENKPRPYLIDQLANDWHGRILVLRQRSTSKIQS